MTLPARSWPLLLLVPILVGCRPAPVPDGYDFVTHTLPAGSSMAALLEGSLAITHEQDRDDWCLVVVQGSRNVTFVAWPDRFALVLGDDGKVEVHGDGRVFRQGEDIQFGGGEIGQGVRHSIPGACGAPAYFAAQTFP